MNTKHENATQPSEAEATISWRIEKVLRRDREFVSEVVRNLPKNLDPEIKLGWINNPAGLAFALQNALIPCYEGDELATQMALRLFEVFNKHLAVDPLPAVCTEENMALWAKYNMRPVFLPGENIGQNRQLDNWLKPEHWFYKMFKEDRLDENATMLIRGWYLVDFSVGVNFDLDHGQDFFPNDPLSPLIEGLRREGKIGMCGKTISGTRFAISKIEWHTVVLPALASEPHLDPCQLRLERFIEFNAIGNMFDPNRGKFYMWQWFEDKLRENKHLSGGDGLDQVCSTDPDDRNLSIAGRPLGVL